MNRENLKSVSDALHNGAEPSELWDKMNTKHAIIQAALISGSTSIEDNLPLHFEATLRVVGVGCHHRQAAELICRAVNNHDALVTALTNALERLEASQPPDGGATFAVVVQCRLALLNAKPNAEKSL